MGRSDPYSETATQRTVWCERRSDGVAHGPVLSVMLPAGHTVFDAMYEAGIGHGRFREFSPTDGAPMSVRYYAWGRPCGEWVDYDMSGDGADQTQLFLPCELVEPPRAPPALAFEPAGTVTETTFPGCEAAAVEVTESGVDDEPVATWCELDGVRDGPYLSLWPDGGDALIGQYSRGQRTGEWLSVHPTARWAARGSYVAGERDGEWHFWHTTGAPERRGSYAGGLKTGTWSTWSGEPVVIVVASGPVTIPGSLVFEGAYADGLEQGPHRHFWETGIAREEVTWDGGEQEGAYTRRYSDGQAEVEGGHRGGLRDGVWTWYLPGGQKVAEGGYEVGLNDGVWRQWDATGHQTSEVTWSGGVEVGTHVTWSRHFELGLWMRTEYPIVGGLWNGLATGTWEVAATKARELPIFEGDIQGTVREWWPSGGKYAESTILASNLHGPYLFWWEDGQPRLEATYFRGLLNHGFTTWHDNGQKASEGSYAEGRRVGVWTFWDEDGAASTVDYSEEGS